MKKNIFLRLLEYDNDFLIDCAIDVNNYINNYATNIYETNESKK